MTIEMGSLYEDGVDPDPNDAGELVSFRVVGTGTVHVGISVNGIRGGIVNEDTSVETTPTITDCNVQLAEPTCMASTHPDFATWQSLGEPDCWCYPRQCRGDIDGAQEYGVYWVLLNDLDIFKTYFQQTGIGAGSPGLCADLDHAIEYGVYRVLLNDLDVFKTYFQQTTVPCCDDNEDCDLTGDTQFNFWLP
jgi:hypothetical protein